MKPSGTTMTINKPLSFTGSSSATLEEIPAEFLWDVLIDFPCWARELEDVVSIQSYDPRDKMSSRPEAEIPKHSCNNNNSLAKAGSCYIQKRYINGRLTRVQSQFTRVDQGFVKDRRTFVMNCEYSEYTFTSTWVLERLPAASSQNQPADESSSLNSSGGNTITNNNDNRGVRVSLTYAMLPNSWYGKFLMWFGGQKMREATHELTLEEIDGLLRFATAKYYKDNNLQPPASNKGCASAATMDSSSSASRSSLSSSSSSPLPSS